MRANLHKNVLVYSILAFTLYALGLSYMYVSSNFLFAGILASIPFVIGGVYLSIRNFKVLFGIMVLSLPLSINFSEKGSFGISLPGELIVVFVAGLGLMRIIWEFERYKSVMYHWLTKIILLHVVWMFVTVITSSMSVVSIKFFVIRLIYVLVFYVLSVEWMLSLKNKSILVWLYAVAMIVPILVSIDYHSQFGFSQAGCYMVGDPFYNDHTIYAACLAMLIPSFCILAFSSESHWEKLFSAIIVIGLSVAILLSYSRAGWGSLCVALLCGLAIRFGVTFKAGVVTILLIFGVLFLNGHKVIEKIKQNDTESSEGFLSHASSVSNISTDNSNKERLNRWACALRMFESRPVFGFGPGTYSFQYGQFQHPNEMTWVSVRDGSVGGVHSEYLKPLAEMGAVGFTLFMIIAFGTVKIGIDLFHDKTIVNSTKYVLMGALLGYITYLVHGFVNFFLDTDKSSVLFWGFIALVVAIDIERKKIEVEKEEV